MLEYYHMDIRSSNAVITVAECKFNKISNTLMYSFLFLTLKFKGVDSEAPFKNKQTLSEYALAGFVLFAK